ncbi:MAG: patatin-like phospholipase family protein [Candidatus Acidiferrales bacterium]
MSAAQGPPKSNDPPIDFARLLSEELDEVQKLRRIKCAENGEGSHGHAHPHAHSHAAPRQPHASDAGGEAAPQTPSSDDEVFKLAHECDLVGLTFSGGGIRSATFNLGVLQGLANLKLLPIFDYLSTVSGGGYIGSWLIAWIYRLGANPGAFKFQKTAAVDDAMPAIWRVQESLNTDRSEKVDHGESKPIRFLREYSNYLTPRLGFLGADTWTAVAIYIRNVLLNQTILILFLSFLLLLPYLAVYVSHRAACWSSPYVHYLAPAAIIVLILTAQLGVAKNMLHLTGEGPTGEFPPFARQGSVLKYIVVPLFLAAWCLTVWIWHKHLWTGPWWTWLILGLLGFGLTWFLAEFKGIGKPAPASQPWDSARTRWACIGFSPISSAVAGLLLWVVADKILRSFGSNIWHVVSFGTPLIVCVFLLVVTLQIGLMGRFAPDPRREWWGRFGGWLLILALAWAAGFGIAIYAPLGVVWSRRFLTYSTFVWAITTLTGVLGGKSAKTGSLDSPSWKGAALSVTPYVFIFGLASLLATALEATLAVLSPKAKLPRAVLDRFLKGSHASASSPGWIVSMDWKGVPGGIAHAQGTLNSTTIPASPDTAYISAHWQILCAVTNWHLLVAVLVVAIVCLFLAWRVDLNEFSMNLFYRNRLVRCYLGASRKPRNPNPFTGFDPSDDLVFSSFQSAHNYSGPFPIVNTTLNLVKGQNLAWQERKSESFVITPLHCGFDTWLERLDLDAESRQIDEEKGRETIRKYGFRPAEGYAYPKGFRTGAAVSISGAAASPNMGYHSSASLAFLMTFFNVRLGFWAGNPRRDATWTKPGPHFGLFQLLDELFGLTDDEAKYVYLSDGGHFENLGLYELIKRRCKFIIVCDADADGSYAFGDLGNAIRKCREDIGVEITLATGNLTPKKAPAESNGAANGDSKGASSANADFRDRFSQWHCAIGRIRYDLVDRGAAEGILIYLKTSLTGDEPADVLNYHREHPAFPHETTANQWFSESQFESYRRLGQHVVEDLFDGITLKNRHISDIFNDLKTKWRMSDDAAAAPKRAS